MLPINKAYVALVITLSQCVIRTVCSLITRVKCGTKYGLKLGSCIVPY